MTVVTASRRTVPNLTSNTDMSNISALQLREKYHHFRILVIGRANAGKTTLLKRVCNTSEEPCIYDEENNNLLEPTSGRGVHDIRRAFGFASNPEFIFHDSPGFETGDERQLKDVQSFIAERAGATKVDDQLHAIWFCFILNKSRPLLDLEKKFFDEARAGNVPVVAVFTKFDDLITQIYNEDLEEEANRRAADRELQSKFQVPLMGYKFPPKADVCMEDLHNDDGDYQIQVKELINKTADSLDGLALKILFSSVQQNNLELCIRYACTYQMLHYKKMEHLVIGCLIWFRHSYFTSNYHYEKTEIIDLRHLAYDDDDLLLLLDGLLKQNSHAIAQFLYTKSFMPTTTLIAAVLLCAENSFWHISKSSSFIDAFQQAFESYVKSGQEIKVEIAVKALGDWPDTTNEQETYRSNLLRIILDHRLPRPD
jgi:GTP-binding protein EngB required for normal cell division